MRILPIVLIASLATSVALGGFTGIETGSQAAGGLKFADLTLRYEVRAGEIRAQCEWRGDTVFVSETGAAAIAEHDFEGQEMARAAALEAAFRAVLAKLEYLDPRIVLSDGYFADVRRDTPVLSVLGRNGWRPEGEVMTLESGPNVGERLFRFTRAR